MLEFAARFEPDRKAGGFVVTFPDIPEAITQGDTEEEAMEYAEDALISCLEEYMRRGMDVPAPRKSRRRNLRPVRLPALAEAKVGLYSAMRKAGARKADLARKLRCSKSEVDRLLDLRHSSRLDLIERALAALGKRLVLDLKDAA